MGIKSSYLTYFFAALIPFFFSSSSQVWAAGAATTTTLTVTSSGSTVTSVPSGRVVTLTASVFAGSTKVTTGQVNFCDASVNYCTDIHLLGTAQLTIAGTAVMKFVPAVGGRSYKAVFAGTTTDAGSSSSTAALEVTGLLPSMTAFTQTGLAGDWALTVTVGGSGAETPTGQVSLVDASSNNALLGTATLGAGTANLSFLNPGAQYNASSTPWGGYPGAAAVGDFNGDGLLDILGTTPFNGYHDAGATALLGDGNGEFNAAATADIGSSLGVIPVAVGDFNGDGIIDVAVGATNKELTILLGKGDGSFTVGQTLTVGGYFAWFVVGDFNGDGIPDLAVGNSSANLTNIFVGKGDGTFAASAAAPSSLGGTPLAMATGDFNGDKIADLAITANTNSSADGTVTVLLGNGDGSFTKEASPATGKYPTSIALGDFNQDGKLDLAVANSGDGTVTILIGNGDGTFAPATGSPFTVATALGQGPNFLAAGDFNGDGKLDLIVSAIEVLLGRGDGTFVMTTPGVVVNGSAIPSPLAVGDFNGDGLTDFGGSWSALLSATQTASATANGIAVTGGTGSQPVVASSPGDSHYQSGESAPISLDAAQGTPAVALTISSNPINVGTSLTLTATVTGSGLEPTGTVTFYDGSAQLGTGALNGGVAPYASSTLAAGSHSITASYGGDVNYTPANSAAVVLIVAAPLGISIPAPPAVSPGSSVTATATIAAGATYSGTLNLACALTASPLGAQSLPTCSLKPTRLTLTAGSTGTCAFTVSTTAASTGANLVQPSGTNLWRLRGGGAVVAVLLMCGIPARRRRWVSMAVLIWLVTASFAIGCGGGTKSTGPSTAATTAGNYTFTITGTDSTNATTTISTRVVVTVQ